MSYHPFKKTFVIWYIMVYTLYIIMDPKQAVKDNNNLKHLFVKVSKKQKKPHNLKKNLQRKQTIKLL